MVDASKISRSEVLGGVAAAILVAALIFLDWFSLTETTLRVEDNEGWLCGVGELGCTGFDSFPILRWLLIAAATAPFVLAWIMARQHSLSWAPGEMTMVVGFTAFILILYNGIIDKPGQGPDEIGISLEIGYYVALAAAAGVASSGIARSMESQKGAPRRAPGTV